MHVQMRHGLAAVAPVVDHEPVAVFEPELLREGGGGEEEVTKDRLVGGRGLADARDELLRDDEHVHRCLRVDVVDGNAVLVFVRQLGRDLAVDDLLEDGLGHQKIGNSGNQEEPRWFVSGLLDFPISSTKKAGSCSRRVASGRRRGRG